MSTDYDELAEIVLAGWAKEMKHLTPKQQVLFLLKKQCEVNQGINELDEEIAEYKRQIADLEG
jgi:peptidoglycan hydrolase CwlO-like protein